jgi:hypothetical protein
VTGTIPGMEEDEARQRAAEELRRIRESVREAALLEPRGGVLPQPRPVTPATAAAPAPVAAGSPAPPRRPDNSAVNASWAVRPEPSRGLWGLLTRLLLRFLGPSLEAQQAWNSRQVQLDNEILEYIDARADATHRHYDGVLGLHGRRMSEIDERHLILQEELVAHVHDLVKRIDLVLGESERGRLGLESALRDLRHRLQALEERLRPR